MNKKLISAVLLVPLLSLLSVIVLFTPTIPVYDPETGKLINYIPLIRPPIGIVSAHPDAPALDTSSIALFGWINMTDEYGTITNWDIYDSVGVMLNYTDHTDAIDGFVRVWDDGSAYTCTNQTYVNGATSYRDENCYIDISVRVRSDTVLIAYMNQTQTDSDLERGHYIWWNHTMYEYSDPTTYGLTPSRAMEIIVEDAMSATWTGDESGTLNYTRVNYYDYEFTSSDKLFAFGYSNDNGYSGTHYTYSTVESGSTIDQAVSVFGCGAYASGGTSSYWGNCTLTIYNGTEYQLLTFKYIDVGASYDATGWFGYDVDSYLTVGEQVRFGIYNLIGHATDRSWSNHACLIWTH